MMLSSRTSSLTMKRAKTPKQHVPPAGGLFESVSSLPSPALAGVLLGLTLLVYANSLGGKFVFDDTVIVQGNKTIQGLGLDRLREMFGGHYWKEVMSQGGLYRPVTMWTFAVNYAIGGEDPVGYHLVNVILHAFNGIVLFLILELLFARRLLSFLSAVLFLLHPIRTEGVASIVGRTDCLAAFFVLLAWWAYLKGRKKGRMRWFIGAALAFLLATLSKESGFAFLLLAPLTDYFLSSGTLSERYSGAMLRYLPLAASAFISLGIRAAVLGGFAPLYINPASNPLVDAGGWTRFLTATYVFGKYLALLCFPLHLSADYSYNQIPLVAGIFDWRAILSLLALGAVIAATVAAALRAPFLFFCSLLFFSTFLGTSNWIRPIGTIMAERLMYLPAAGFTCALALALCEGLTRARWRSAARAATVLVILACSLRIIDRNLDWRDHFALFASTSRVSPNSFLAQTNFASVLLNEKNDVRSAIRHGERAVAIRPEDPSGHFTVGEAYRRMGDLSKAAEHFGSVARLAPGTSGGTQALRNLASILDSLGRVDASIREYEKLLEWRPNDGSAWIALSRLLARSGRRDESREVLERARRAVPSDARVQQELGRLAGEK